MASAATATVKAAKREIPFAWEGRDKRGARIKGRSLAPDEQTLRAELRRQGVAPSKIRKQRQGIKGGKPNAGGEHGRELAAEDCNVARIDLAALAALALLADLRRRDALTAQLRTQRLLIGREALALDTRPSLVAPLPGEGDLALD